MDIAQLIEKLSSKAAWFRMEVTNKTAQDFFGYPKRYRVALSPLTWRQKPLEAFGDTPLEALVELDKMVEAANGL